LFFFPDEDWLGKCAILFMSQTTMLLLNPVASHFVP